MNYINLTRKILMLLFIFLFLSLDAMAGYIPCALNTDCRLIYYTDYIVIPTIEKADYKCHLKQEINTGTPGIVSVVTVGTPYRVDRVNLGQGNYEENIYIPSRNITAKGNLSFFVEYNRYKSSACLISSLCPWEIIKPTISVNCTKL